MDESATLRFGRQRDVGRGEGAAGSDALTIGHSLIRRPKVRGETPPRKPTLFIALVDFCVVRHVHRLVGFNEVFHPKEVRTSRNILDTTGSRPRWQTSPTIDALFVQRTWPLRADGDVPIVGRMRGGNIRLSQAAANASVGIALLPAPHICDELATGKLVRVLEKMVGDAADVSLVFVDREFVDPKVRALIDRAAPVPKTMYSR